MSHQFADIAFPVPLNQLFTYEIPESLRASAQEGVRAIAPFGRRTLTGFIVALRDEAPVEHVKKIYDILDDSPIFTSELIDLTAWVAQYYFASWGDVLKAAVPQGMNLESRRIIRRADVDAEKLAGDLASSAPLQARVLQALSSAPEITVRTLQQRTGIRSIYSVINSMAKHGFLEVTDEILPLRAKPKKERTILIDPQKRDLLINALNTTPKRQKVLQRILSEIIHQLDIAVDAEHHGALEVPLAQFLKITRGSTKTLEELSDRGLITLSEREVPREYDSVYHEEQHVYKLTEHQQSALERIVSALEAKIFSPFLLFGVTGSGKTQVYLEAVEKCLSMERTAIVLVPEISLTTQIVERFRARFGSNVGVFHSRMSIGERYDTWRLAHQGKHKIVIGPRSAIFSPLPQLGLIIVDEEQDPAYKQFDSDPRYNARDVALKRGQLSQAAVILGSATPSIESFYNAENGKYQLLELPERIEVAQLPSIEIIDMRTEWKTSSTISSTQKGESMEPSRLSRQPRDQKSPISQPYWGRVLSQRLREKIEDRLVKREGIILLQNRRGFAPFIECLDCGYVEMCVNCHVSLTYHAPQKHLRCHYCGFVKPVPTFCPRCGGYNMRFRGTGTQRVEDELEEFVPRSRMLRMDLDTTTRRGAHAEMLKKFSEGDIDILLGTQMVAKGLDFSRVTLVGVISAETQMLLPDFRSSERTFQLLTQVAGRAGRSALAGEVLIQTHQPDNPILKFVAEHNYREFYKFELEQRREVLYPPFARIVLIELKGEKEDKVATHAEFISDALKNNAKAIQVLGPAPAAIPKIRNRYRYHILVKSPREHDPNGKLLHELIQTAVTQYQNSKFGASRDVRLVIDVDPQGMM